MAKEQPDFAIATPVEARIKNNGGKQVVYRMMATSRKTAEEAVGTITQETKFLQLLFLFPYPTKLVN